MVKADIGGKSGRRKIGKKITRPRNNSSNSSSSSNRPIVNVRNPEYSQRRGKNAISACGGRADGAISF
ncbi:hypothetical protein M0804_000082 [Polistes exclamans]|nr:hypothetical protein M0804_000082 [Polistes exclamans]